MNLLHSENVNSCGIVRPWVAYVGPFAFPNGGAAARRILGVSKSMQAAGFDVKVACGQVGNAGHTSEWFEGIEVFSLAERTSEHLPRLLKHMTYFFMGSKTVAWLDSLEYKPQTLILYSGYSPYLLNLLPWARRNRVHLVFDAVEWYDPHSFLGWLSPYQINIELAMRLLLPRVGHVLSISHFLHHYYLARGCQSLLMPPTLDVTAIVWRTEGRATKSPLKLVYAGSPGRKDLLNSIVEAVLRMRSNGHVLRLSVAGIAVKEAGDYPAVRNRAPEEVALGVDFVGMLSHEASMALVREADFSLLLRQDARYSRAGFPTKFVESFAVGTPVIANLTSDLAHYLKEGETGFICAGSSPEDMEIALTRALTITNEQHSRMRARCRTLATEAFDYRTLAAPLSKFLPSAQI
ncbi:MAG: glycosyltransferase [Simplicispira suum]|uniref:glycosyltransferase n=1 Tax=Simplicispira suum TaxID=2109915 RepID=UPI001C6BA767|nr:glycosyltransferase [Simplicispira suum]MBW7832190.1 glycosyltransferase [Simplicispira suum]